MAKERENTYDEEFENEEDYGEQEYDDSYDEEQETSYDDEAYSEEEAEEPDEEGSDEEPDLDELRDFANLFGYLEIELTRYASGVPLTNKKLVDTAKCMNILENMKLALPETVKYCWRVYEEKDRIIDRSESIAKSRVENAKISADDTLKQAQDEANNILANAKRRYDETIANANARADAILKDANAKAKRLVSENEIVQRAKSEAALRIENARVEARERRLRAVNDAYRLLDALEKQTIGITEAIARKKEEMTVRDHE